MLVQHLKSTNPGVQLVRIFSVHLALKLSKNIYLCTAISPSNTILEWGECLSDCPQEEVTAVCVMEPIFPTYADGISRNVNFTSNYIPGSGVATLDVNKIYLKNSLLEYA